MVWQSELREIDQHQQLRTQGLAARGSRRRWNARAHRQLRESARLQTHYSGHLHTPSASPLTEWGRVVVGMGAILLVLFVALLMHLR